MLSYRTDNKSIEITIKQLPVCKVVLTNKGTFLSHFLLRKGLGQGNLQIFMRTTTSK